MDLDRSAFYNSQHLNRAPNPLVSVVTPVFNGEAFLRECVESVLGQTYENWDYTIVNNCSTDRSLEIAREYAARDPRIRVEDNKTFVPVIDNYNIAVRQISPQSKYCKVVAADDWLFPECLEKMVGLAEAHPTVAIVGAYAVAKNVLWTGLSYPSAVVVGGREAARLRFLEDTYVFGTPTTVLYRSSIVRSRHAFYNEENKLHADAEACLEFLGPHDFGFVHQVLTFQRERKGSLSAYSKDLNTYLPSILYELVNYGRKFLSEDELRDAIAQLLRDYYRYLGEQTIKRRGPEFWDYHRGKLQSLGYPFSVAKLAASMSSRAVDLLLNPKRTAEAIARRLRGMRSRPSV